jgi:hypothetical protein
MLEFFSPDRCAGLAARCWQTREILRFFFRAIFLPSRRVRGSTFRNCILTLATSSASGDEVKLVVGFTPRARVAAGLAWTTRISPPAPGWRPQCEFRADEGVVLAGVGPLPRPCARPVICPGVGPHQDQISRAVHPADGAGIVPAVAGSMTILPIFNPAPESRNGLSCRGACLASVDIGNRARGLAFAAAEERFSLRNWFVQTVAGRLSVPASLIRHIGPQSSTERAAGGRTRAGGSPLASMIS